MPTIYRQDPDQNVNRFYTVDVAHDLFGRAYVQRTWGRIGSRHGSTMMLSYPDVSQARISAARIIRNKRKKGYRTQHNPVT